jgi:hypothetical protein
MSRLYILAAGIIAASAAVNAAQIEVGQYAGNTASGATMGLTSSYISGTSSCVGAVFQGNSCIQPGNSGSWVERNYDVTLFSTANLTSTGNPPVPYTGYNQTSDSAGKTMTDSAHGETFAMIDESSLIAGASKNFWYANGANTVTIPIGLQSVSDAYLMLNNLWGQDNPTNPQGQSIAGDTEVIFNFGANNSTTVTTSLALILTNGHSGSPGQIRDAVECTGSTATPNDLSICSNYPMGPLASSSTVNGVTVLTNTLYNQAYSGGPSSSTAYMNTSGNLVLDDQGFIFGNQYLSQYLVSIQVAELNGNNSTPLSGTALSAITVDTASTPEPSTIALVIGGLGLIGLGRRARRKA